VKLRATCAFLQKYKHTAHTHTHVVSFINFLPFNSTGEADVQLLSLIVVYTYSIHFNVDYGTDAVPVGKRVAVGSPNLMDSDVNTAGQDPGGMDTQASATRPFTSDDTGQQIAVRPRASCAPS